MRKADREITDVTDIEAVLRSQRVCRLGMISEGRAYVVPVNYGYDAGALYFHSSKKGKKIEALAQNPEVCFEVDADVSILTGELPCQYTTQYRSVIGFGRAVFLDDPEDKLHGLRVLMRAHDGPQQGFVPEIVAAVAVVRIDIESMTGKSLPAPAKRGG
ncbi:pyridoxamine 5'-phosphate oxidase family protein [Desulfovibrio sulfodismutans]|uniref:Pyridoxamine 5'-phosphate oxidase family protein n=1 Tax=Desulfolutivibrio sulfodismutans TaxID=63561 RepID=A0A7K3NSY7_9BACT|nr:pyridoxamine 5'-phosphate oxidase family protein [Desulfolutivibrio sulfodismutans]NDY58905.1 pyridoxamine 5'-phosphate oxidase family protein [Desulfolutivibrio sulfodismutans]QLA13028.1 pyridoxamine 5'-phosphate oxidase family protein [Desulfolutivibrio sulfodismutans DSM 3696]